MQSKDALQLSVLESDLSIDKAINGTSLSKFITSVGKVGAITAIAGYLKIVSEYFNVQSNLSEDQAISTAGLLLSEYPQLTIEDVMVAMKEAKMRKEGYEKPYGMVDGAVIFSWINVYFEKKLDRQEQLYEEAKKERHNAGVEASVTVMSIIEKSPELMEKLKAKTTPLSERKTIKDSEYKLPTMKEFKNSIPVQAPTMKDDALRSMLAQLKRQNIFGAYTPEIKVLEDEIKGRRKKK